MSNGSDSPLLPMLLEAGGVAVEYHDRTLIRHFGDPAGEYAATTDTAGVVDRSHRTRLMISGRSPTQMLNGILTGRIPEPPVEVGGVWRGLGTYHAVLTPKGKMVSDLWAYRFGDPDGEAVLLDVPVAGASGLIDHLRRFLPPRFAKVEDVSAATAAITLAGPDAASALSRLALGLRVEPRDMTAAAEGTWFAASRPVPADNWDALVAARTEEVWPDAWTVLGPVDAVRSLWRALVDDGATPAGLGVWSTLRVEHGRPVYGTDMDDTTLPPEAGIVDRAIDHAKGCYTGQEVIVRIRDRGHVNRTLRRLELGDVPAPTPGTELLATDGSGKVVGTLTSIVQSPRAGGVVALGYVRRGVSEVLLGDQTVRVPTG